MKKLTTFFSLAMIVAASSAIATEPVKGSDYTVDATASKVQWTGSKITGSSHTGTIAVNAGMFTVTDGAITGGEFVLDMNSIMCTDLDGGMKKKLEGHLKSEDFFGVEKFPTAELVIKGSDSHDGHMHVTGELTIKGKTHPITFDATLKEKDGAMQAMAKITFDRSKYDVRYGSKSFFDDLGDKTINDEVGLTVELMAKKQ